MAEALKDQLGPQPDFQRMGPLLHEFASEVDKLQNIPQFDTGRAILEAIKNLGTELGAKLDGFGTELNAKLDGIDTKLDGIGTKIDGLRGRMQIMYVSPNYLSLFILTNPVTKILRPVFKTPIFTAPTMS